MPICVLDPRVVEKIAAGEVIERPASVVKELIENSLDAGATRIAVSVSGGGLQELTVSDDGCGIPAAEIETAFLPHATSKLTQLDDLERLKTLGFRGEALASIAAVADVAVATRHRDEEVGSLVRVRYSGRESRRSEPRGEGTVVTVRDLFSNVPARRRFLRRPLTEAQNVISVVSRYAIAHADVAFSLTVDGRETLRTLGGGLQDAIRRVYGPEIGDSLVPFAQDQPGLRVHGYAGPPSVHRSTTRFLDSFVNGRLVQDRMLTRAVMEAYRDLLPGRRYPVAVLLVEIDGAAVDVNVHPAKAEVSFAEPDRVFQLTMRALRAAVSQPDLVPSFGELPSVEADPSRQELLRLMPVGADRGSWPIPDEDEGRDPPPASLHALPPLRPVGQIQLTYIVAEGPDGMYLVDQHAAHERILYERFLAKRGDGDSVSQALLSPLPVELGPDRAARAETLLSQLADMGFQVEPFGPGALLVRSVPAMLAEAGAPIENALLDLVDTLAHSDRERWLEHSLVRLVCHAAVRAGQRLEYAEMQHLLRDLEATSSPRTCPHGRPTMLYLSAGQLEREFGRT